MLAIFLVVVPADAMESDVDWFGWGYHKQQCELYLGLGDYKKARKSCKKAAVIARDVLKSVWSGQQDRSSALKIIEVSCKLGNKRDCF